MSDQHKTTLARVFNEVFNENRLELIPELYTEDFGAEDPASRATISGHDMVRALVTAFRTTFPGHHYTLHEIITEGDIVCARWTVTDTTNDPHYEVEGLSMCKFKDGKIAKVWQHWDDVGLMQQLGKLDEGVNVANLVFGDVGVV